MKKRVPGTHDNYCHTLNTNCPCLSCKNDFCTGDPLIETKCCDYICHKLKCSDTSPCPDYELQEEGEHEI